MNIENEELQLAYEKIKKGILESVKKYEWDKAYSESEIWDRATSTGYFRTYKNEIIEANEYYDNSIQPLKELCYIRDQILAETGKRIWGLTFTLYPDGKYEIEYDYNVPEGFNEKGEWIGQEHGNTKLSEFFENIFNIGTDKFELK